MIDNVLEYIGKSPEELDIMIEENHSAIQIYTFCIASNIARHRYGMEEIYKNMRDAAVADIRTQNPRVLNWLSIAFKLAGVDIKKYLNNKDDFIKMNKSNIDDIAKGVTVGFEIFKGVIDTGKAGIFQADISNLLNSNKISQVEAKLLTKIFKYQGFATYIRKEYSDTRNYETLRNECIQTYNTIKTENTELIAEKYFSKEFLNK